MKDIAWLFSMSTKSVLFAKRFCKEGNWLLNCPLLNLNSVLHVRILGGGGGGRASGPLPEKSQKYRVF